MYRVKIVTWPEFKNTSKFTHYYPQYRSLFSWYSYEAPNDYEREDEQSILNVHFKKSQWSAAGNKFNYCGDIFFYTFEDAVKFMKLREYGSRAKRQSLSIEYKEVVLK